jgi:hypothetical protein
VGKDIEEGCGERRGTGKIMEEMRGEEEIQ